MACSVNSGRRPNVAEAGLSPIFVRPVREQLEHDRLIRFLTAKYKKRFDVTANVGDEQIASVKIGQTTFYPDLMLTDGKKLAGLIEVESGESVNNLEAMAQWVHFSKVRAPFYLYVPVSAFDVARRLCEANQVRLAELWTYRATMDGFDLVRGFHDPSATTAPASQPAAKKPPTRVPEKPRKPAKPAKPAVKAVKASKPAKPAKAKAAKPARPAKAAKKNRKR